MKNIITTIATAFLIIGCSSELDISSPSELTAAGFWDTEEGATTAHTGLYANLRGEAWDIFLLGEIRSDIWGGRTYESPSYVDLIESNITISTAPFSGWAGFYTMIHRVNDFLINVPNVEFTSEAVKNHMIGQALGIRAFYYYNLMRTWGSVPIILEPFTEINPEGLSRARSSEAEVMQQIKADLEASLQAFGSDNSLFRGSKNYWSKAATLALKGDVYIWSANLLGGGSGDFNEAKSALQQIGSMGFSLESSFESLWGVENENNSEFIFAIQYKRDEASNIYNFFTGRSTEINPQYDEDGNSMSSFIIAGANRFGQSEKTIQLLEDNDDSRKKGTFIRLYTDDNGGSGYATYDDSKYFGAILKKFLGRVDGSDRIFENDVPLFRYADVLLLLAEAKIGLGEDPSTEINAIRQRAYGDNFDAAVHGFVSGNAEDNKRALLEERYKEFIGEGKRWWDLRRAGNSYVMENISFLNPGDEYKLLLPVSEGMIGRNPLLEQTPGYTN